MAQTGFTPIQLYYSSTASAAPSASNLANGELALNITDGKLFYKDNLGAVQSFQTMTNPTITGTITEDVYTVTTASATLNIDPTNGSIQVITLGQSATSVTFSNFGAGESVTLMIADGAAFTIAWSTSVTWVAGTAPTLALTGYTVLQLWKVGTTTYGAIVGAVA